MNKIKILFVDGHPLIRKAWNFLFGQDDRFDMIGVCESGEMAIELSEKLNPDIVIIDHSLRGMTGLEATRIIRKNVPSIKVIGLSYDIRAESTRKIMQNGATGCLSKTSPPEVIYKAIMEVHNGRTYICPEMATNLV